MLNSKPRVYHLKVSSDEAQRRLDVYLTSALAKISRAQIRKLIDNGHVRIEGRNAKASYVVKESDRIAVEIPPPQAYDVLPEEIPLEVLYEDEDIIVINKPAGMVVHPAAGHIRGTLVNALLAHCRDLSGIGGEMKPGIVHRLDRGTSGVMVVAKNDVTHLSLSQQFRDRSVKKIYTALIYGPIKPDDGVIEKPIGRSVKDRKVFSSQTRKGRIASTEWHVIKRYGTDLTLLEIRLHTGRTHQIRVHMKELGHPLVGDLTYGSVRQIKRISDRSRQKLVASFARPALHATRLGFMHPVRDEWMEFEAPLPEDFRKLLSNL